MDNGNRVELDWNAVRAEYLAGGVGQRVLARKWGVSYAVLRRRAETEGWVAMRGEREGGTAPSGPPAAERHPAGLPTPAGDSDIALRLRRKLLQRLEKMADEIPAGAVTEYKTQDDSAVKLFKLRDLTAAYKELASDLPLEEDREGVKVVLDV